MIYSKHFSHSDTIEPVNRIKGINRTLLKSDTCLNKISRESCVQSNFWRFYCNFWRFSIFQLFELKNIAKIKLLRNDNTLSDRINRMKSERISSIDRKYNHWSKFPKLKIIYLINFNYKINIIIILTFHNIFSKFSLIYMKF